MRLERGGCERVRRSVGICLLRLGLGLRLLGESAYLFYPRVSYSLGSLQR
jgi:hypothetical protein